MGKTYCFEYCNHEEKCSDRYNYDKYKYSCTPCTPCTPCKKPKHRCLTGPTGPTGPCCTGPTGPTGSPGIVTFEIATGPSGPPITSITDPNGVNLFRIYSDTLDLTLTQGSVILGINLKTGGTCLYKTVGATGAVYVYLATAFCRFSI